MKQEGIKELFSDKAFIEELLNKETAEEVQKIFAAKDIDVTIEEVNQFRDALRNVALAGSDEVMSDDDLDHVAGGTGTSNDLLGAYQDAYAGTNAAKNNEAIQSAVKVRWGRW